MPTTASVSLFFVTENRATTHIAVVGSEGMVGMSVFMGGGSTPSRAVVKRASQGFRLDAGIVRDEFTRSGSVMQLMLRYTQVLITSLAQTAVCNRHRSLDQQPCRCLLLSVDPMQGSELVMPQELIAANLGVRREACDQGCVRFQGGGSIRDDRDHNKVVDRIALADRSCACYAAVKKEYDRLLLRYQASQAASRRPASWR